MNKKKHACFFLTVLLLESTGKNYKQENINMGKYKSKKKLFIMKFLVARSNTGIEGPKPRNQVKYFGEEIILSCTSYFDDKL